MCPAIVRQADAVLQEFTILDVAAVPPAVQPGLQDLLRVGLPGRDVLCCDSVANARALQAVERALAEMISVPEKAVVEHVFAVPLGDDGAHIFPDLDT